MEQSVELCVAGIGEPFCSGVVGNQDSVGG